MEILGLRSLRIDRNRSAASLSFHLHLILMQELSLKKMKILGDITCPSPLCTTCIASCEKPEYALITLDIRPREMRLSQHVDTTKSLVIPPPSRGQSLAKSRSNMLRYSGVMGAVVLRNSAVAVIEKCNSKVTTGSHNRRQNRVTEEKPVSHMLTSNCKKR